MAPGLVQTYRHYKDRGVAFVGLTAEGESELPKIKAFLKEEGIPWPNGYGAGATLEALGVEGFPTIYVVTRNGNILWDSMRPGTIEGAIERALALPGS